MILDRVNHFNNNVAFIFDFLDEICSWRMAELCWNNALWLLKIVMWLGTSKESVLFQYSMVMLSKNILIKLGSGVSKKDKIWDI